jgi:hypothetical protein
MSVLRVPFRRRRPGLVALLLVSVVPALAVLLVDPPPAHACSCAGFDDQQAYDHADVVFTGTIESVVDPDSGDSRAPRAYTFAVDEVQKGDAAPRQVVRSEQWGASCGLELTGTGPFVVFAETTVYDGSPIELGRNELYAGSCGGTRPISDAQPLQNALVATARPPDASIVVEPPPDDDGSNRAVVVGAVAAVIAAAGITAVCLRRRSAA